MKKYRYISAYFSQTTDLQGWGAIKLFTGVTKCDATTRMPDTINKEGSFNNGKLNAQPSPSIILDQDDSKLFKNPSHYGAKEASDRSTASTQ